MTTELEQLIAEQKRDDRAFQAPEKGTVPYGLVLDVRDQNGSMTVNLPRGAEPECVIHGRESLAEDPTRGYRCRVCDRDRKRLKYKTDKRAAFLKRRRVLARARYAKEAAERDGRLF